jgi:hypothetical protein
VISDLYEQATKSSDSPPLKSSTSMELTVGGTEEELKSRKSIYRMRSNINTWLASSIPLPRVLQQFIGQLLFRLTKDAHEVIVFLRRQFQAIIGILRGQIAEHSNKFSQHPNNVASTSKIPDWASKDEALETKQEL